MSKPSIQEILSRYRDLEIAKTIVDQINKYWARLKEKGFDRVKIMHVCGTHEHTITYYGIRSLLPEGVELIAGPGCPVCIVPAKEIDYVIELCLNGVEVYTYGDMFKVPGSRKSLAKAKAEGGNVKVVYSFLDAVKQASNSRKDSVFFAVGFETTQPSTATQLHENNVPRNLSLFVSYRLTVPAMKFVLNQPDIPLNGVIAPGHVSTIVGASAWRYIVEDYGITTVVAGFEPLDVLLAVLMILKQLLQNQPRLINEYTRAVPWDGNVKAKQLINGVFDVIDREWRGLGILPLSGLKLKEDFKEYDAEHKYNLKLESSIEVKPGCRCPDVVLGRAKPTDCPMFMKACTPSNPMGPCMVSSEGTCAIWAKYGGEVRKLVV
ncbi:MAG: hydrogenase formation protein HypD [Candidatus Methanomethylicota archaeon]|uniref:Hydrogenase formation protein HypD n=1 Tax=Thermoproteota archaeon TaxID=2056631 RepID=A0A497F1Q3_9CREN|nr:MAG: hydrogenase formation protein HypD [Candidatus Verstraetearchaeota archaeon]